MPKTIFLSLLRHLSAQNIFWAGVVCVFALNIVSQTKELDRMSRQRAKTHHIFLGDRFRGLEPFIDRAAVIGYYTDKSLDDPISARQFAQAQLVLAPTMLALNNTRQRFIIFDCSRPAVAAQKIQEIGAVPLRANPYGIIFARLPDQTQPFASGPVDHFILKSRPKP